MKVNSIVFRMMTPLVIITVLVLSITFFVTQTYLKKVVEDIFIELQVHHLEQVYTLKMENVLLHIKQNGLAIATSKDVEKFLLSDEVKHKKISRSMQEKLLDLKKMYEIDHIYVAERESKNYYDENGFVKVVDIADAQNAWYLKTLKSKKRFFINADSDITGSLHIWADVVVGNINKPLGFAGCGMDISHIYKIAWKDFGKDNTNIIIINSDGIIRGSSNDNKLINISYQDSNLGNEKIDAIQKGTKEASKLIKYHINSEDRYLLFIPIKELDWTIIIDFSKEKYLASLHGVYDRIIAGGLVLLLLIFVVGALTFSYFISKPLKKISYAVKEFDYISNFEIKECSTMGYELKMICDAFNTSSRMLRKTIEEYKSNEELLRSIINAADDLIFFKDTNQRYLGCNSAYEKWNSKSIDEIIGKTDSELYPSQVASEHAMVDKEVIKQKRTIIIEEKFEKDDGSFVIYQVKKSPFYDKENHVKGLVVVARDMTMIKKMEDDLRMLNSNLEAGVKEKTRELQRSNKRLEEHIVDLEILNHQLTKAKEAAQQAAQARSNFISGVSHELRTPLNAIINFTDQVVEDFDEMLGDQELQEETRGFLTRVMVNSRHLLQLINDLLEFTKAEAGKMDYKIEKIDVNEIVMLAYSNTYSLLNGTQVEFFLKQDADRMEAMLDSRRFLQILINLLSNAVKFTQHGYVEVRTFIENENIIVEIEDTGKGIPQDKQKLIFEPFMQVNSTDNGTGLGLGLAKRMCDDMGINVSLVSVEAKGTTFRLTIKSV